MQSKLKLLPGAGLCALLSLGSLPATAQTVAAPAQPDQKKKEDTVVLQEFVVTGQRASLASAAEIKRGKLEIVDSIVASDINKLPDYNVTDALQRITGVQILRDRGEGAGITIRGLSQMEHTLNGREIFTAGLSSTGGASRQIDFADVPAEMVAGLNVYKTSSANHIEGGIGGMVEMVTRRPFDFGPGLSGALSARFVNGDLAKSTKPQYSALISDRVKFTDGSELGALVNITYQKRAWREDQKGTGSPVARTDIVTGQTVTAQNSTSENTVFGTRERWGATGVVQYRPSKALEVYGEFNYTKFNTLQDTHQINVTGSNFTFVPGSAVLYPGTSDLKSITWNAPTVSVLAFARDTHDWTKQFAAGAKWKGENLSVNADVSYTKSYNDLFFSGPFFATKASAMAGATFTQDFSTEVPSSSTTGVDLTNPANYEYTGIAYRYRPFYGDLTAAHVDGTYKTNSSIFHTLLFGVRDAVRNATNKPGLIFADYSFPAASRPAATQYASQTMAMPFGFFPYTGTPSIRNYMSGVLDGARDVASYRNLFGITSAIPTSASPLTLWNIKERTDAAYAMSNFKAGTLPLEGNVGVRFVRTNEKVSGYQGTTAANAVPININTTYNSLLPSLNTRYTLADDTFLKFSASKTLTRPDFGSLSPSITLVPNPINPALNQGSAGNPNLDPIKSTNYDLALEKYFKPGTYAYVTVFYKEVKGFIVNSAATETWDGQDYLISRPRNANPAKIKGFEVGTSYFFDFLPDPFKGLGVQANYTYVDSETPNATLNSNTPLPNLSKNSYNVIAMYENKKVSARIAYNWRDKFLSGQANIANVGRIPFYTKAYGWMDASLSYNFTDKLTVSLEGTNLLRTKRESYYGRTTLPQNVYINDRQVSAAVTYRF